MQYLDDLAINAPFPCGSFTLTRAEIIAFAQLYDPQPFHLDDQAAEKSYFGRLCASGLHTQGMARRLDVRVSGYILHEARFHVPVGPDADDCVRAHWTAIIPSPRQHRHRSRLG